MVSRDTQIHIGAVTVAILFLAVVSVSGLDTGPLAVAAAVVFYAIVFGGGHFYLALRGEDGIVPVASRWRYLAMLAVLFAGVIIAGAGGGRSIAGVTVEQLGAGLAVGAIVVYLVVEGVAGYRATSRME